MTKRSGFWSVLALVAVLAGPALAEGETADTVVATVNGITDIIEFRKMEPVFYMTDDPAVWKELGVEPR